MADINSMSFDGSSYLKPGQGPNPLDQILKTNQVMGQYALGQGLQQAIQPDGTIDRSALAQVLKGSPMGALQAPAALTAIEQMRQAGHAADIDAIRNQVSQMDFLTKQMAPYADNPDGVTKKQVMDNVGKGITNAAELRLSPGSYLPHMADFVQKSLAPGVTDQQRGQMFRDHIFKSQSVSDQFKAELPQTADIDTGGQVVRGAAGTQRRPLTFDVNKTLPPGTHYSVDKKYIIDGDGKYHLNPAYGQSRMLGTGGGSGGAPAINYTGVAGQPTGAGVRPPGSQNLTDTMTGYQGMPSTVTSGGQPTRLAQPGDGTTLGQQGSLPADLPPGATEPLTASGTAYAKDLADSREYAQRMNPLKQAIPLLEKSNTGPGTETIQHVQAFAQAMGLPVPNEKSITNYAEAKKYLSQNAAAVAPPGTNIPSVLNAFEANPNMQQPKQAAVELSKMLYGLGRLKQASVLAFQKTGLPAGQYTDWASKWVPQQDIRGYTADLMTPQQRKELTKQIKPGSPQAANISNSYKTAKSLGLLGDVERP